MGTENRVEKVSFRIESNNCLLRTTCALCGCYDRPDVTWCVTDEEGHWICPACAEANDPVLAEVVQTAIEGHFGKLEREAWGRDRSAPLHRRAGRRRNFYRLDLCRPF